MKEIIRGIKQPIINPCVMCENEALYLAKANYKSGTIEERLCEDCAKINQQNRTRKNY